MKRMKEHKHSKKRYKEEYEDEEDYEENDNYENDGFLVDDDEVEEEEIYERPRFGIYPENDFEEAQLESEVGSSDNEVILDQNLSKKKTRLKKHRMTEEELKEKEKYENNYNLASAAVNQKIPSAEYKQSNRQKFIEDNEEDENDFIEKTDNEFTSNMYKANKAQNKSLAHKIFTRDLNEEEEEISVKNKERESDYINIIHREDLAEEYMRPQDIKIIKADVPERILLKFNENINLEGLKKSIDQEADWLIEKFPHGSFENIAALKKKIILILESYKCNFDDIPYIVTYKRNFYEPELTPKDVWKIFECDREWNKLFEMKANLTKAFETIRKVALKDNQMADLIYCRYIENAKSISDLNDMEVYIEFLKELHFDEFQNLNEEMIKILRPNKSSQIQTFRRNHIDEFARKFSINAFELSSNLEHLASGSSLTSMIQPPEPDIQPERFAKDFESILFDQEIKIMSAGCKFLALELFSFPFIRNYARYSFKIHCTISTEPTEEGRKELEASHPSFRVKRIKNKPIETFDNDLFLDILEAEKKGWILLSVNYRDNFFTDISDKLNHAYNSKSSNNPDLDNISHSWRVMREETLRVLIAEHCIPYFIKEVKEELKEKAENFVINECAINFYKLLLTGPYKKKKDYSISNSISYIEDHLLKVEEYPRVLSLVYENSKNEVYAAMVDGSGEIIQCSKFSSFMTKPSKMMNKEDRDLRMEDEALCKQIIQDFKPDLIVISANDLKCKYLKDHIVSLDPELIKKNEESGIWTTFGDLTIPRISANCPKVEKLLPNLNYFYRLAVCLARFKQNPLAEICQLWHEDLNKNFCLSIPLHPLMKIVNRTKLSEYLESEALKATNLIGVDINKLCEHAHLQSSLQFISGLGPRKAKYLIEKINQSNGILMRNLLVVEPAILREKVYFNCAGFIRVKKTQALMNYDSDPLDITRIHPENYPLANKIVKSAMDENFKDLPSEAIKIILKDPRKIHCLDLQEYIRKSQEKGNKYTKFHISFITNEFQNPFKDERPQHSDLASPELFYLLLGDPSFKDGQLAHATVLKVDNSHVKCRLSNDLEASAWFREIFDEEKPDEELVRKMQENYKEGMVIDTRVIKINFNNFKVDLTLKPSKLRSNKQFFDVKNIDQYFDFIESEDLINHKFIRESKAQISRYQHRNIQHNYFKNYDYKTTLDFLRKGVIGGFLFRPSSKGNNYLNLSWKFYDNCYAHVEIIEEDKQPGMSISNRLRIGNEYYRSLTEITDRYLKPCEMLVKEVINSRKFFHCDNVEEFEHKIKEEKNVCKNIIVYYFTILSEFPLFIVMGHSAKAGSVVKEYIRVKPNGFYFHNSYFSSIEELSNWFKKNYFSETYRDYVKRMKAPMLEENSSNIIYSKAGSVKGDNLSVLNDDNALNYDYNSLQNTSLNMSLKDNTSSYDKDRNYASGQKSRQSRGNFNKANKTCHNCNEYGHFASECQNKSYRESRRNNDSRNNRDFINNKRQRSPNTSEYSGFRSKRSEERNSSYNNINNTDLSHKDFGTSNSNNNFNAKSENVNTANTWISEPSESNNNNKESDSNANDYSTKNNEVGWSSSNVANNSNNESNDWGNTNTNNNEYGGWSSSNANNNSNTSTNNITNKIYSGHDSSRNRSGNYSTDRRKCYNCGDDSHLVSNCPKQKKPENFSRSTKTCFKCKREGHFANNCTSDNSNNNFRKPKTCFNCGGDGHKSNECDKPRSSGNFSRNRNNNNFDSHSNRKEYSSHHSHSYGYHNQNHHKSSTERSGNMSEANINNISNKIDEIIGMSSQENKSSSDFNNDNQWTDTIDEPSKKQEKNLDNDNNNNSNVNNEEIGWSSSANVNGESTW